MISPYLLHIFIIIGIYIILAVSLNIALGFTGLLNLGHIAFFGIGAYTSALLTKAGVPFFLAFIAAGIMASIFGFFLVYATRRLKGDYLGLATLGFNFVIYSLFLNLKFTRGPLGIPGIPKPEIFGYVFKSNMQMFVLVTTIMVICVLIMTRIAKSPWGRLLEATRDDAIGLRVLGKNTFLLKTKAMVISAFFAGIAGSLFAHYISFIDPSSFILNEILLILTIVIIGGLASIRGSIAGTIIIILIPEALRFATFIPSSMIGPLRQIFYAIILIGILLYRPRGIFGKVDLE